MKKTLLRESWSLVLRLKSPMHAETKTDCIGRRGKWFNLTAPPSPSRNLGPSKDQQPQGKVGHLAEPLFLFRPPLRTPRDCRGICCSSSIPMGGLASLQNRVGNCPRTSATGTARPPSEPRAEGRSLPKQTCDIRKSLITQVSRHKERNHG